MSNDACARVPVRGCVQSVGRKRGASGRSPYQRALSAVGTCPCVTVTEVDTCADD